MIAYFIVVFRKMIDGDIDENKEEIEIGGKILSA